MKAKLCWRKKFYSESCSKIAGYYGRSNVIICYFISCSSESNSGVEKNSPNVISNPSQIFLIVTVPGFLLSPFRMLLIVACGTAEMLLIPFGVSPRSLQSWCIAMMNKPKP